MLRSRHGTFVAVVSLTTLLAACADGTAPTEGTQRGTPAGWVASVGTQQGLGLDTKVKHGGSISLLIAGSGYREQPAILSQFIRADNYLGKRVRLSAWVHGAGVAGSLAGLWMRVDGPGVIQGFDNMQDRAIQGSVDWTRVSIVMDVPDNAIGIALGVLYNANGTFHVDDMQLEIVGTDVPQTNPLATPLQGATDSVGTVTTYASQRDRLLNLDFEGLALISKSTTDWLASTATTLTTTDPTQPLTDLTRFGSMVGEAHVVGLGEATHGTRDFFLLKHRMIKYLVTQKGFTDFAIEATTPEAADLNLYLQTGVGDPKVLLSHLYFWIWNTQEVLDMIKWMREWNVSAPAAQRIRFWGVDVQYHGASMDSVETFIAQVDPAQSAYVRTRYTCMDPFRNHGSTGGFSKTNYAARLATSKAACAAGLKEVFDLMAGKRVTYTAASNADRFEVTLHHARLVQQFEAQAALSYNEALSSTSRDSSMAENVQWIRGRVGPSAKLVLWAHNLHVNNVVRTMGRFLRSAYGNDYLSLGFAFRKGTFNAVGTLGDIQAWRTDYVLPGALEEVFENTGKSLLLFDTRTIASGGAAAEPLSGPIAMRSIGSAYSVAWDAGFFSSRSFPTDFDMLLFVLSTTESTRLPFVD